MENDSLLKKIAGLWFVFLGLIINPWSLTFVIRPADGQVSFESKLVIVVFEIFCFLMAAFIFVQPVVRKRMLFTGLMFLIVVVTLEIGLRIVFTVTSVTKDKEYKFEAVELYKTAPYKNKAWASKVFSEYLNITLSPAPYIGFKLDEFRGEYLTIDADGVRKTWNPEPARKEKPKSIYVFGGSTTLGYGARDDYTIPSYLSKILHEHGYNFKVFNYGGSGTTFATEVMRLVVLLRDGHKPDYVVFYDGTNDVAAGYSGQPRELNSNFKNVFHSGMPNYTFLLFRTGLTGLFRENCMIYKAFLLTKKRFAEPPPQEPKGVQDERGELELFSKAIVDYYMDSKQFLDHLTRAYGFQYFCFWQPNSFLAKKLLPEDKEAASLWLKERPRVELHRYTNERLKTMSIPHFYNIADVLDDVKKAVYPDWCHISEEGNAIVAARIFEILKTHLK